MKTNSTTTATNSITLKINGEFHTLHTHDNDDFESAYTELYKAQDLMKAAGLTGKKAADILRNWKDSLKDPLRLREIYVDLVVITKGLNDLRGTYLTKKDLFKLAAYIDHAFYDAVFEAFELLTMGKLREASDVAYGHVISAELKERIKKAAKDLNEAITKWVVECGSEWDAQFALMYFNKVVCQVVTGGSIESLKHDYGAKSTAEYFIKSGHYDGVEAYIATCENMVKYLNGKLPYEMIKTFIGYTTQVDKNN